MMKSILFLLNQFIRRESFITYFVYVRCWCDCDVLWWRDVNALSCFQHHFRMDQVMQFVEPSRQFVKDSIRLVKRCTKPDRKGMSSPLSFNIQRFKHKKKKICLTDARTSITSRKVLNLKHVGLVSQKWIRLSQD